MTFYFPIPPHYLPAVRIKQQPHAEVSYSVEGTRVAVEWIAFGPQILPYLVRVPELVNEIQEASENNWRSLKSVPDEAETNYKQENNW
jgi:hypothetical protein